MVHNLQNIMYFSQIEKNNREYFKLLNFGVRLRFFMSDHRKQYFYKWHNNYIFHCREKYRRTVKYKFNSL